MCVTGARVLRVARTGVLRVVGLLVRHQLRDWALAIIRKSGSALLDLEAKIKKSGGSGRLQLQQGTGHLRTTRCREWSHPASNASEASAGGTQALDGDCVLGCSSCSSKDCDPRAVADDPGHVMMHMQR